MGLGFKRNLSQIDGGIAPDVVQIFASGRYHKKVTRTQTRTNWGRDNGVSIGDIWVGGQIQHGEDKETYTRNTTVIDLSKLPQIGKYKRLTFTIGGSWSCSASGGCNAEWNVSVGGKQSTGKHYSNAAAEEYSSGTWPNQTITLNNLSNPTAITILLTGKNGDFISYLNLSISNITLYKQ